MMKGSDIRIQEKKAKLFNEWERFASTDGESIETYYHHFSKLMNDFKRNKHFLEKIASNLKFLNNLQLEWSRHATIVHQTKELHTADYTQLYDFLKYNQKEVDDLRAERLAKTQNPLALMENSNNPFNYFVFHPDQPSLSTYMQQPQPNNNYNPHPLSNQNYMQQPMPNPKDITDPTTTMKMALVLMAKAFKLNYSTPTNNNQRISSNPRNRQSAQPGMNMGQDRQMQMVGDVKNQNPNRNGNVVAARVKGNAIRNNGDLDEIEEFDASCILMANLQQASTSGTQTNNAPVYDLDGSTEYNRITNVIPAVSSVKQDGGTVEQHPTTVEETRVYNTAKTRRPHPRSNTKNDRVPSASKSSCSKNKEVEVEEYPRNLLLSKNKRHMSSEYNNVKLAIRNDKSKFLGTVRFGNDHVAAFLGYGDLQWGNIMITKVYFIEGLGHNLFSVG
ncbi:hypothetical protein Tco_0613424 [Tanacetum coccineum]